MLKRITPLLTSEICAQSAPSIPLLAPSFYHTWVGGWEKRKQRGSPAAGGPKNATPLRGGNGPSHRGPSLVRQVVSVPPT